MALGERVLANPRLLHLAADPRGPHGLERHQPLGVCPQNELDFLIGERGEQRETPRANPERPPAADLLRQRLHRITSADAVGADGFVAASDYEERGVAAGFGELHENGPGDAAELEALRGGPTEEDDFGAQPERLRLARHL